MKIGIISAMDSEHRQLADRLSEKKESGEGRFRYVEGLLGQNDVVLTQCGIGKVNAAVGAAELIRRHRPDCIVSTGVAGGIDTRLRVGDVVASDRLVYHDVYCGNDGTSYGQVQGMPPRLYSTNHPGMQLIRPLYYVHEHDIVRWKEHCGLRFLRCACKFTEKSAEAEENSKRLVVKRLIAKLKESDPNVDISIFRSMYNVHVDTLIEYESGGKRYDFLSRCRQKGEEKDEENQ